MVECCGGVGREHDEAEREIRIVNVGESERREKNTAENARCFSTSPSHTLSHSSADPFPTSSDSFHIFFLLVVVVTSIYRPNDSFDLEYAAPANVFRSVFSFLFFSISFLVHGYTLLFFFLTVNEFFLLFFFTFSCSLLRLCSGRKRLSSLSEKPTAAAEEQIDAWRQQR